MSNKVKFKNKKYKETPNRLEDLTPEDRKTAGEYQKMYTAIGRDTTPADRPKAEAAMREYLNFYNIMQPVKFFWADGPLEGMDISAKLARTTPGLTPEQQIAEFEADTREVTSEERRSQVSKAGYGLFEAYWIATYAFVKQVIEDDEKSAAHAVTLTDIAKNVGLYWVFDGAVVLTEKPSLIALDDQDRPHNESGPAIAFPDGTRLYGIHEEAVPSLAEARLKSALE